MLVTGLKGPRYKEVSLSINLCLLVERDAILVHSCYSNKIP